MKQPRIEKWPINKLKNWTNNPRDITPEGFERLKRQIQELDVYKPLLISEDGTVLGGNMRLRAFKELGIKDVSVSIVKADTEEQKIKYALSDNDQVGRTDKEKLLELIENYPEIKLSDYAIHLEEPQTLDDFMAQFKEVVEDEVPEVAEGEPISKYGEVYQLGRHRLMCGDATKIEDVEKLMDGQKADMVFTDPPYGIEIVGKNGKIGASNLVKNQSYREIIADDTTEMARLHYEVCKTLKFEKYIIFGGNYFLDWLPFSPSWIIWDKRLEMTSNNFADGEMAWTNIATRVRIFKHLWNGMIRAGDDGKKLHPTQKPTKLLVDILKEFTNDNDLIVDAFGGSGSTLIACEQTNRICYMMEIDPKYCDVIRKRYENFIKK